MTAEELRQQDVALVNLRCAEDLPGANDLNIAACLQKLDQWAARVRSETERHLYRAHDARYAKEYRNSEPYFRVSMMLQVLQEDCGVHYNMQRVHEVDFTKSQDLFIHGLVASDNGGTCVSMPVLYTAIARRLGYPVYLVTAKAHLFCRWDHGKERFNIEGSGSGFSSYDDDYYTKWPLPISPAEVKAGLYLKSLSPGEELAVFLSARGHCLEDNGRVPEARVCYAQALQRRPDSPDELAFIVNTLGFQPTPDFHLSVRRRPLESAAIYPTAHNPYAYSQPIQNPGMGNVPPTAPMQPYNVFKPYTSPASVPSGNQSPLAEMGLGFSQ